MGILRALMLLIAFILPSAGESGFKTAISSTHISKSDCGSGLSIQQLADEEKLGGACMVSSLSSKGL
jgi:hypothetical protein